MCRDLGTAGGIAMKRGDLVFLSVLALCDVAMLLALVAFALRLVSP